MNNLEIFFVVGGSHEKQWDVEIFWTSMPSALCIAVKLPETS